ncbi:hypothetical protein K7432_013114 [Basidiobolus ranarum]|uniref:Phosphatidic acid phosphatase type 2/haloperoxidase domain-containing protein n=1 Tax=Basidiobolus ranarum TaxID=34480 RepID=A0ABR2VS71_9FUNG
MGLYLPGSCLYVVLSFLVPLLVMSAISLGIRRSSYDCHCAWLGLSFSMSLTLMITHILKTTVGRLRPDFLDRCQPDNEVALVGLIGVNACTQANNKLLLDGMKSFPSGHTSLSFAGLAFLTFYLAGKLHLFDRHGHIYKSFVCSAPLIGATLVGVSRICNYRHHWEDVLVGSLIDSLECDRPYSSRLISSHDPSLHHSILQMTEQDDAEIPRLQQLTLSTVSIIA